MSITGFLNENEYRCYPLRDASTGRPESSGLGLMSNSVICDFGCVMGLDSLFDRSVDYVYLSSVAMMPDGEIRFTFMSSSRNDAHLRFTRSLSDPPFSVQFAEAVYSGEEEDGCDLELMEGFLVTGDLSWIGENLSPGQTIFPPVSGDPFWVEPSTVTDMTGSRVRSVNVANLERTRVAVSGCQEQVDAIPQAKVVKRCVSKPIRFTDGSSCRVATSARDKSIIFFSSPNTGKGYPCQEQLKFPSEVPDREGGPLEGGYGCSEVLSSLGGATGSSVRLSLGRGLSSRIDGNEIEITATPDSGDAC